MAAPRSHAPPARGRLQTLVPSHAAWSVAWEAAWGGRRVGAATTDRGVVDWGGMELEIPRGVGYAAFRQRLKRAVDPVVAEHRGAEWGPARCRRAGDGTN